MPVKENNPEAAEDHTSHKNSGKDRHHLRRSPPIVVIQVDIAKEVCFDVTPWFLPNVDAEEE